MKKILSVATILLVVFQFAGFVQASDKNTAKRKVLDPVGIKHLKQESSGKTKVSISDATGAVRFVAFDSAGLKGLDKKASFQDQSMAFFQKHGSIFGLRNASVDLKMTDEKSDFQGGKHLTYAQYYFGVPVFAGVIKTHFDTAGQLRVVNGNIIPDINVDPKPNRSSDDVAATALARIIESKGKEKSNTVQGTRLMIFRSGMIQGVPGQNHLVWEVEVGNGADVREFVYVDAHTGKVVDQITGIADDMNRQAYDGRYLNGVPPEYPNTPFWVEGDAIPTTGTCLQQGGFPLCNLEADNMLISSEETFEFFDKAFGRDSFDAVGGRMDSIFDRGYSCPNASWNGIFISFCPGTTTDDVTTHEWGHAYTQYTHGLIYQWQSGALNESYSDIWGETVDQLNGRMTDNPGGPRAAGLCSTFTPLPPKVTINSPASIAGDKAAGTAAFGSQSFSATNDIVLANDGDDPPADGCNPGAWPNAAQIAGKFALVDRGTCGFVVKAKNAQVNGAVGLIVANNQPGIVNMAGVDPTVVIPSLSILQTDGAAIKTALLTNTVNASISRGQTGTDNSVRWLVGEDASAFGGAIRDMWNPLCYANAGKVTDTEYFCGTGDNGGVHLNSSIPNHAYALIVDGGVYNGHTITGLGLTKAAHIYFRAMTIYQHPATDFAAHELAIEQSAADLVGVNLPDLLTGLPSGQIISSSDVAEVAEVMDAVQMSTPPTQCNFQPLLAKNPPPLCDPGDKLKKRFEDGFEDGNSSNAQWSVSHEAVVPADFTDRDWVIVNNLPDNRPGKAFFGVNPNIGTCAPGGDESGVLHLTSPKITIPASASAPRISFDHWVATELGWDGGNLKISVNDGPWQTIQAADFIYNPYNLVLNPAPGNTDPLAGQPAFTGTDQGSVDGSWGRSIINLAAYAGAKDKIRIRLDIGNDGCTGLFGWYIDDFLVYTCK